MRLAMARRALNCRPPWTNGNSMTLATCGMARYTGATQGKAPTVRRSPRACKRRSKGSVITASPIHCGAMIKELGLAPDSGRCFIRREPHQTKLGPDPGPDPNSLMPMKVFAVLQLVERAAIRALGLAGVGHIQIDLGVAVPQLHVGFGLGQNTPPWG